MYFVIHRNWLFGCCVYLKYFNSETCQSASTNYVQSTNIPINPILISRLKLLGVLIGKRLAVFISEPISLKLEEVVILTDAATVLQWLNSHSILPQFIHGAISEIKRTPSISVRYIFRKENPADIASRSE